jgi:uncharacterized Zn finger protein
MIECKSCGSTKLQAVGVVSDTVGARCTACGTGHILTVTNLPDKEVEELVDQIFVDWPDQIA